MIEPESKPLILISNDDGFTSKGIAALAQIAQEFGDVVVVAPDGPRSGQSAALTVNAPLRVTQRPPISNAAVYSVNGTPVDCVKLGLHAVLSRHPDLMLSGINHGSNAAVNNLYSGTMGAAMEACLTGIPAIGFSLLSHDENAGFDYCQEHVRHIISTVLAKGLPRDICLNVNFPKDITPHGVTTVRAAEGYWSEEYADYTDPHGVPFYWLTGKFHNLEPDNPETDEYWLAKGYGTIVPIRPGQSATDMIPTVKTLFE